MSPHRLAAAADAIRSNLAELRNGEVAVTELAAVGAFDHVALYAQTIAERAAYRHTGAFSSCQLEAALMQAAATLPTMSAAPSPARLHRVLHVATETPFPEGGHTRVIDRWIRSDPERIHSVALTSPRGKVAPYLASSVAASGGRIHTLAPHSASFMKRAGDLRHLAQEYDLLVLHPHLFDAVPTIALATAGRPPTIAYNLAGERFWIGRSAADVVACGRQAAVEICLHRRAIPGDACIVLPVPAESGRRAGTDDLQARRWQARAELSIGTSETVLLTVASAYKLDPVDGYDLPGMVAAVIGRRPDVVWLVVGTERVGRWGELCDRAGGRIRCFGLREELTVYSEAADAYLDSYPFTSQTALVDAAATGLPVLALRGHPSTASILGGWGGSLDTTLLEFSDAGSLLSVLAALDDPAHRAAAAQAARVAVSDTLTGPRWGERLMEVYELARLRTVARGNTNPPALLPDAKPRALDELDEYVWACKPGDEPLRAFLGRQRERTNTGAHAWFPGDETWLAQRPGVCGLLGELELALRDHESRWRERSRTAGEHEATE